MPRCWRIWIDWWIRSPGATRRTPGLNLDVFREATAEVIVLNPL
jgi:hypothetical protein